MSSNNKIIKEPTANEKLTLRILIVLGLLSIVNFFYWFLTPEFIDHKLLYWMLMGLLSFDSFRVIYIWYHYWDISVPEKPVLTKILSVDVFTTYFPGEPYDMIKGTLLAIQKMKYPHTTYLCDEANDAHLKEFCEKNGIKHVTRDNRIDAKAGNINNALKQATGDICLILDPDHVPKEDFLDEIIPYFEDKNIGFVQSVQAYYNVDESLVAKAAAEQTFHFYGPVMMSMNTYGTVNAIGANCVFRRKALDSIGGHAAGLSEDMHTAMQLYAKGWKSIYVPKVFTKGLVPGSLTSYYKQQLKWSRGTLELLVSVFPKLYNKLTWRQKIHFGILPLHYLSGLVFLICFLIPIISLFASATPWKGNIINFGLIVAPVLASVLGIRLFVQRWVMDKSEWGTHFLGGLLQACTWWINIIGLVYTITRKKIPYLPTPKEDNERTSWKILVPNLAVGVISVIAVIYGLSADFTPFSVFMSGFALVNASFMFYTLVFAFEKPKPVKATFEFAVPRKSFFNSGKYLFFSTWQKAALPLVVIIALLSGGYFYHTEYIKWEGVQAEVQEKNVINYVGIFAPRFDDGITGMDLVRDISDQIEENFDIISHYLAWDKDIESSFPDAMIDSVYLNQSIPMITWEPWLNTFEDEISSEDHLYDLIINGFFDLYISEFADILKDLDKPIFLRFAHEFDNPFYPWYMSGDQAASSFKGAWIHTYEIFKNRDAHNVIWIWNPWKPENVAAFYPGREYVDWIGINILDYGEFSEGGQWYDFESLYSPFHKELRKLPLTPVVIAEFGTLQDGGNQNEWIENAFTVIENNYSEIKSVIYFNSSVDKNWPDGMEPDGYLDWTIPENRVIKSSFRNKEVPHYVFTPFPVLENSVSESNRELNSNSNSEVPRLEGTKGINLKYGNEWRKNYHVLNRRKLLSDFDRIKNLGFDSIKITGNSVYVYNILNISRELELDVSFGFRVSESIDFMNDTLKAVQLHESILNEVKKHKNNGHISSWNIQNDVLYNQKDFFHKPELLYQNRAYLIWLSNLVSGIKEMDSTRPVIVDLEVNLLSIYHADLIAKNVSDIDYVGLTVKDDQHLHSVMAYFEEIETQFIFSEINTENLIHSQIWGSNHIFFVTSWQDEHESNKLTFDGITDRKGRPKNEYFQLQHHLSETNNVNENNTVRILKPARRLYESDVYHFYSMIYKDEKGWVDGQMAEGYSFEWSLVKQDEHGNHLAIRDIHEGPVLELKIPKNYDYFKLLLTVTNNKSIATTITRLNTPLVDN
ncbi:MAG: glycosyltransferase [Balneolaceae bacterium]|nr:glycosyltransferase [Balneolaceae bacterium]